ncbi:MAG: phenylalanine--tRNA ligase subunit alpha [Bacteroidota bacterium]
MQDQINAIRAAMAAYAAASGSVEEFKRLYTGKKGAINGLFDTFRSLPKEEKAQYGKLLNEVKQAGQQKLKTLEKQQKAQKKSTGPADMTLPGDPHFIGARHPLAIIRNRIISIFGKIGFTIADGPEIENDWYNFTALNIPEDHPARDMQDTFFLPADKLLRTHTSNVQIRVMESQEPPIRILAPGMVFRNETVSARAHAFFHQVEGLYVDRDVSFPDMVQVLDYFAKSMFGAQTEVKLRPSFFPFTEISAEMDVSCMICDGGGCNICKYTGWVEIMGCGMVDPAVLENCGIDPDVYSGYAFGMGIERIAMLVYGINDLRLFSQNDIRFLKQFELLNPY